MTTAYQQIITVEPGKRGGRPCIRGTRIAVADILGWLAAGMSHKNILDDYPVLTEQDIAPLSPTPRIANAGSSLRRNEASV
jgi:uncharacterized protein (DUF433 family)